MEQSFVFGILAALASLALLQAGLAWRVHRSAARIARFDDRLAHLGDAMGLLTETSEMGFRSLASELERRAGPTPAKPESSRRSTERVAAASRRGRTVTDIAAAEKMSEGEVRLRLQLAGKEAGVAADAPITPKKAPARKRPTRRSLTMTEAGRR
ncbi:MAG: hypothetical protein KJ061_02495 [Vicinamibacteraceae bacterium]|nr:hypothetical protein [Vicinamibacteraceae bacterium]